MQPSALALLLTTAVLAVALHAEAQLPQLNISRIVSRKLSKAQRKSGCLQRNAWRSPITKGWKLVRKGKARLGYVFNEGNRSQEISPVRDGILKYTITPRVTSHYAIVLDMTTRQCTHYNDIWLRFPDRGGMAFRKNRPNSPLRTEKGWIKVYQHESARAAVTSVVDGDPHPLSTFMKLEKGKSYRLLLSGRSNLLTFHRIMMFPCTVTNMPRTTSCFRNLKWWNMQEYCFPGSTAFRTKEDRNCKIKK